MTCEAGKCSPLLISCLGETVCQNCGLVLSSSEMTGVLEMRAYARSGEDGAQDSRVGLPVNSLLPNMSMGTRIGGSSKEAARQRMLNLHYAVPYQERALLKAFKEIGAGSVELGLQDAVVVAAAAKDLFARIKAAAGIRRGALIKALPAVSTYFAAKLNKSYRPREMVCRAFGVTMADFAKCYKHALDCSRNMPYYQDLIAAVEPTSLTTLMLNTLSDIVPSAYHHQLKRTVLKLHDLVAEYAPDIAHQKDVTLIAAEVMVACELHAIACPKAAAATCAGVSQMTLGRYVRRVRESLPAV